MKKHVLQMTHFNDIVFGFVGGVAQQELPHD